MVPLVGCNYDRYSSLQGQHLDSVVPFLGLAGRPNEEQILYRSTDRQFLWDNDHSTTGGMPDEFRKVFGHCLAVVRDRELLPACAASANTSGSRKAHQPGRMGRLKVNAGLTPKSGFHDNVVEVGIGLKTHAHG